MLFITIIIGHWSSVAGYLVIRHFALVSWAWSAVREYWLSVCVKPLSFRGPWTIDEDFQKEREFVVVASTVQFSESRRNIRERGATVPSLLPALAIQIWRMHFRFISFSCKKMGPCSLRTVGSHTTKQKRPGYCYPKASKDTNWDPAIPTILNGVWNTESMAISF